MFEQELKTLLQANGATLIGFSRLYLFVHFPTDVLVGFVVAVLVAIGVDWAFREVQIRRAK